VKLRNRYTHDYYIRETSEDEIEKFCLEKLAYLELFLEESVKIMKLPIDFNSNYW